MALNLKDSSEEIEIKEEKITKQEIKDDFSDMEQEPFVITSVDTEKNTYGEKKGAIASLLLDNSTKAKKNKTLTKSLIFGFLGLLLIIIGSSQMIASKRFLAKAKTTTGTVIRSEKYTKYSFIRKRRTMRGTRYRIYVTFTVDGKEYKGVYDNDSFSQKREGSQVMVYYDPTNPSKFGDGTVSKVFIGIIAWGIVVMAYAAYKYIVFCKNSDDVRGDLAQYFKRGKS